MRAGIRDNFYRSVQIVRNNRKYCYFVLLTLFSCSLIGFMIPGIGKEMQDQIIDSLVSGISDKNLFQIILFIIFTNLKSSLLGIIFGVFFGIFPVFAAAINGYFLGAVLNGAIEKSTPYILWKILPHGIFEIPAICIAYGLGLRIGLSLFRKNRMKNIVISYKEAILVFFFIILPLLLLAGTIEGLLFHIFKELSIA